MQSRDKHPSEPFVVGAEIILDDDDCIDLLDVLWERRLVVACEAFAGTRRLAEKKLPRQTDRFHGLDRVVINFAVQFYRQQRVQIRAVRAAFQEGEPVYPESAIYNRSHVQIVVRDASLILQRWAEPART